MVSSRYAPLVEEVVSWASREPGVRAVLVVGSQARASTPADEWSDLDLALFVSHPEEFLDSRDWVGRFGTVILSILAPTAVTDNRELRTLYSDGKDVDFSVLSASGAQAIVGDPGVLGVVSRGYEVVLDKDGLLDGLPARLSTRPVAPRRAPTELEFRDCVTDFWYHVLWSAKKLRRGELWTAKMGCDGYLKGALLQMIEWETLVRSHGATDVWHQGRFMDRWAPRDVSARLPSTFARYEPHDLSRALEETGRLFSDLARQVAGELGFAYPQEMETRVRALAAETLGDMADAAHDRNLQ